MNKYFTSISSLDELRKVYKDLLKANHPDNGGSVEATQEINVEYKMMYEVLKSKATESKTAEANNEPYRYKWDEAEDEAIREALSKIIYLDNINIELVGSWIWVDGDTYAHRDIIKSAGFKWSKARKKWHFAPYEGKFYKGKKKTFDQIRQRYGSAEVENEAHSKIAG